MAITEKLMFVDSTGKPHETREQAQYADVRACILRDMIDADFWEERSREWTQTPYLEEFFSILKKHLDPVPARDLSEDEQGRACDELVAMFGEIGPTQYEIEAEIARHNVVARLVNAMLDHRGRVMALLGALPASPRFDPLEAPIDEAKAFSELCDLLQWLSYSGHQVEHMIRKRAEVIRILQGIERPEPISEDEAKAKLKAERFANAADWSDGMIVQCRAEVIAILQAVR